MIRRKSSMNPEARRWRAAFTLTLAMTATLAYAQFCPPQYQEEWVAPYFVTSTQAIKAAIAAVDAALTTQLQLNTQRLTSAVAVLTKQKAVAANAISTVDRNAAEQTANALGVIGKTQRVKEAYYNYGTDFGQGIDPCAVLSARESIAVRDAEAGQTRRERVMTEVDAAPGRYADPVQAEKDRIAAHAKFCSADQAASGLCSQGSMPGADLNVATLFQPTMEGEDTYDAKVSFVNNVVGLPDGPVPQGAGQSVSAQTYSLAKDRKDAQVSPAIAALKDIQLDYSGVQEDHDGTSVPLALQFQKEVGRYAGNTPEYKSWSQRMVGQNERGVMLELLRVKALDLAILEKQYRQYEMMEAQVASLVSMELSTGGMAGRTAAAGQQAVEQNIQSQIK
jgi:hypothetical protein